MFNRHLASARAALFGLALLLPTGAPALAQNGGALPSVPLAEGTGPALWVVRDADSTLYLFGTIHMMRPDTAWRTGRVDEAFDSASQLILEVVSPDDQATLTSLIREHGISPDRPLSSLLPPEYLARLDVVARTLGGSAAQMDSMRPWLAGVNIESAAIISAGYDPRSGVEPILKARAMAAGMTVSGFETPEDQILMLAGFPEDGQLAYLRASLDAFGEAQTQLDQLVEAWVAGDTGRIRALAVDPLRATPVVYERLLVRRNTDWADQIQTLLEGSGTVFIAVGSMHLTGDDSVQQILLERGVEVSIAP